MLKDDVDVSLVIPAYDEEATIEEMVARVDRVLSEVGLHYEVIVVDDGSADGTESRALEYSAGGKVRVLGYDKNMGVCALKHDIMYAVGDY